MTHAEIPYRVVLKISSIHGKGCYAGEPIPGGAFIIEYSGELIEAEEAYRREADPDRTGIYTFWAGDDWAIDGYREGNDARFINHSCTPNCDYRIADRRVLIDALERLRGAPALPARLRSAVQAAQAELRANVSLRRRVRTGRHAA